MIGMRCTLCFARVCSVCGQERNEEKAKDTAVLVVLYGVKRYAVCCCCGQEVYGTTNRNYRARWRRWAKNHT